MTSLTPARDAALKAIDHMKADLAEELAGDPAVALQAKLTVDLNTAASLALADCSDREISTYDALKILEISFANAIATIAGSTCAELSSMSKVAGIFISHVAHRCAEVIEDNEPGTNYTAEIERPQTGSA